MEGILQTSYRGFNIKIEAIDADNWTWKVTRLDGSVIAECDADELEYDRDAALEAAKEATDEFIDE